MTHAEATVQHAIFGGIVYQWHKKEDPMFARIVAESIQKELFSPAIRWAVEEYLQELNGPTLIPTEDIEASNNALDRMIADFKKENPHVKD